MKLIEYIFSAVNIVPSNPCVGPAPNIKIYFFLLSTCTEKLMSASNIITSQTNPPKKKKKVSFPSNPIPYPEYLYLLIQAFLVNLTVPRKLIF